MRGPPSMPRSFTNSVNNDLAMSRAESRSSCSNTGNNAATDTDTLTNTADLQVTDTFGQSSYPAGTPGGVTYTIVVTNYGPAATTTSTLTDALPTGFTFGSVAATPLRIRIAAHSITMTWRKSA